MRCRWHKDLDREQRALEDAKESGDAGLGWHELAVKGVMALVEERCGPLTYGWPCHSDTELAAKPSAGDD